MPNAFIKALGTQQKTLKQSVFFNGVGIHSGMPQTVGIHPCEKEGIWFQKPSWKQPILAHSKYVCDTKNATSLGPKEDPIKTIEHLLSALWALGITHASIELLKEGQEIPIMKGDTRSFYTPILKGGILLIEKPRRFLRLKKPHQAKTHWGSLEAEPFEGFKVSFEMRFHSSVPTGKEGFEHQISFEFSKEGFENLIAPARTFGLLSELENARALGLAKGASLENSLPLDHKEAMSLALSPKEPLSHKVSDFMGDISLLGMPILASFKGVQIGHTLNHLWVSSLLNRTDKPFEIFEAL